MTHIGHFHIWFGQEKCYNLRLKGLFWNEGNKSGLHLICENVPEPCCTVYRIHFLWQKPYRTRGSKHEVILNETSKNAFTIGFNRSLSLCLKCLRKASSQIIVQSFHRNMFPVYSTERPNCHRFLLSVFYSSGRTKHVSLRHSTSYSVCHIWIFQFCLFWLAGRGNKI